MSENPNTGCLEGMRCPKCGSYGPLKIEATTTVTVHDDGTDQTEGFEWNGDAYCECVECAHSGTVDDFQEENQEDGSDGEEEEE